MKQHDVIVTGRNLELTEAMKDAVHRKAEKLFSHEERIIRLRVELEYNKNVTGQDEQIAKGHIEIDGKPLITTEASEDMYTSIDRMVDKLDRMLRRRSRLRKVKRKDLHTVDVPSELPKTSMA
ncbi:MAG: ribosome hibernation-promoting factor, HPF/YfiA family [Puniceicoccaceae bacterium]